MNTLTPRKYIVEITLKSLDCQPSSQISKAICELHYGQIYVKFKTHPQVAPNGVASFKKQTICIPYQDDIALVFKRNVSSKKEIFLGHYQIEIEEYLQRKIYFIQLTERLYETETYVNFECKIIDKERCVESETEDLSDDESVLQKSHYSSIEDDSLNIQHFNIRQSQSQYKASSRSPRQCRRSPRDSQNSSQQRPSQKFYNTKPEFSPPLQEQFNKRLFEVNQIIKKKNVYANQSEKLLEFKRNHRGDLKSEKIERMQKLLKNKKDELMFNSLMVYVGVVLGSLFLGLILAT